MATDRLKAEVVRVFDKDAEIEVLRGCNPNRHGIIALAHSKKHNLYYAVQEVLDCEGYCEDWDVWDYTDKDAAEKFYESLIEDASGRPNWEAQAEYDEAHGTINGEDAGIVAMRELGW